MSATTAPKTNDLEQFQEGYLQARRHFEAWLKSLPAESARDVTELVQQLVEEDDETVRQEIVDTLQELVFPESVIIKARKEFSLESEDAYVRRRLQNYRRRVGQEIKKLRIKVSMTQEELAERAGIPQSHVSRLETGVHTPTFVTIERLAQALDTSASQLDPGFDD